MGGVMHRETKMGLAMTGLGLRGMGLGLRAMFRLLPLRIIMHAEELGLSDEQVNRFRDRYSDAWKEMIQLNSHIKVNMIDLKNAVMREDMDMKTAEDKAREIGRLKGEKSVAMIHAMHDMREILTQEQFNRVRDMVTNWFKSTFEMPGMEMEEEEEEEYEDMPEGSV